MLKTAVGSASAGKRRDRVSGRRKAKGHGDAVVGVAYDAIKRAQPLLVVFDRIGNSVNMS